MRPVRRRLVLCCSAHACTVSTNGGTGFESRDAWRGRARRSGPHRWYKGDELEAGGATRANKVVILKFPASGGISSRCVLKEWRGQGVGFRRAFFGRRPEIRVRDGESRSSNLQPSQRCASPSIAGLTTTSLHEGPGSAAVLRRPLTGAEGNLRAA